MKLKLLYILLFILVFFSCKKDSHELEFPSYFNLQKIKVSETKVYKVNDNKVALYNGNNSPFTPEQKIRFDNWHFYYGNLIFEFRRVDSFYFKNSSLLEMIRNGKEDYKFNLIQTKLIIDEFPIGATFNSDFSELYICGEIISFSYESGNIKSISDSRFQYCTAQTIAESAQERILETNNEEITFVEVKRFEFVYKK